MNALIEKIQSSLLNLMGVTIERLPAIVTAVDYNTPLSEAAKLLQETIMGVEGVLSDPEPEIDLVSFGDSSLNFAVRYWTLPQQKQVRQVKTRAIVAIKKACDRAGINIPYPIRTLYFYDQQQFDENSPASSDRTSN
jgi:small-conductance mechanosensitive channel